MYLEGEFMRKLNCWEFKKCGREPNGRQVNSEGLCPATKELRLDGIHNGINAGRACWAVAGTLCEGEIHGTYAQKYRDCTTCDFYLRVKREEFHRFQSPGMLVKRVIR
jgi:hypothetical protein